MTRFTVKYFIGAVEGAAWASRHGTPGLDFDPDAIAREALQRRSELDARIAGEREDAGFAARVEEDVTRGLGDSAIGGAWVVSSHCGSSVCQVEMVFDGDPAREQTLAALPCVLPTRGGVTTFFDASDPMRIVLYAHREAAASD